MKEKLRYFASGFLISSIVLVGFTSFGATASEKIDVLLNSVIIKVDGEKLIGYNFTYDGRIYADVELISAAMGYDVFKNKDSNIIGIVARNEPIEKPIEIGNDIPASNFIVKELITKDPITLETIPALGIKVKIPKGITNMLICKVNGVDLEHRYIIRNDKDICIKSINFDIKDQNIIEFVYIIDGAQKIQVIEASLTKEIRLIAVPMSKENVSQLYDQGYSLADIGQAQIYAGLWSKSVEEILKIRGKNSGIPDTRKSWDQVKQELGITN